MHTLVVENEFSAKLNSGGSGGAPDGHPPY